jgi:integrase
VRVPRPARAAACRFHACRGAVSGRPCTTPCRRRYATGRRTYVGRSPNAYVFLRPKGARPTRASFHRIWSKARAKVGVPDLHLHDLRHTGNTLAAETGATLRELMNRMGHRSPRAALIYLHARDHRDREIAAGLDRTVAEARNQPEGHEQRRRPFR